MSGYREIIEEIEGMIRARGLPLALEEVVIDPRDGDLHPDQHSFIEYRVAGANGDIHINGSGKGMTMASALG